MNLEKIEAYPDLEKIMPYLEDGSFWPKSPAGRRQALFFAFLGLGGLLLAAYDLGNLGWSVLFFALVSQAVGIGFFFAWLRAERTANQKLEEFNREMDAALRSQGLLDGD